MVTWLQRWRPWTPPLPVGVLEVKSSPSSLEARLVCGCSEQLSVVEVTLCQCLALALEGLTASLPAFWTLRAMEQIQATSLDSTEASHVPEEAQLNVQPDEAI